MLTKLLFTAAVVAIVYAMVRLRRRIPAATDAPRQASGLGPGAAYGFVALLLAGSAAYYYFQWREQQEIVSVSVVSADGARTSYRAYRKSVDGDSFESLDGTIVRLGADQRLEISSAH